VCHRGFLYYFGGFTDSTLRPSVDFYRVSLPVKDDSYTLLVASNTGREGFGMAAVGDFIYMFGGKGLTTYCSSIDRYSIPLDRWTEVFGTKPRQTFSQAHFGTVTYGEAVYLIGGKGSAEVHRFDSSTERLTQLSSMHTPRFRAATTLYAGFIYIFGGETSATSFEKYDISQDKWELFESSEVINMRYAIVIDGVHDAIFLFGREYEGKVFHPSNNSWSEISSIYPRFPSYYLYGIECIVPLAVKQPSG